MRNGGIIQIRMVFGVNDLKQYVLIGLIVLLVYVIFIQWMLLNKMRRKMQNLKKTKGALFNLADKINSLSDDNYDAVYDMVLKTAIDVIPNASKGSILILEDDGVFHYKSLVGYTDELKALTLRKEEAFLYKINNFSKPTIINNPLKLDEKIVRRHVFENFKKYQALDVTAVLSTPIYVDKKLMGIINVDTVSKKSGFVKEDLYVMSYLRYGLQFALKNSQIQMQLREMADYDELTRLYNRRCFKRLMQKEIGRVKHSGKECSVIWIDIDNFKRINDTYGHSSGDEALRIFAEVISTNIRKDDICGRISGDEFVVLLNDCTEESAYRRVDAIADSLKNRKIGCISLTFSYGVHTITPESEETVEDMLRISDNRMYINKKSKNAKAFDKRASYI